VEIKLNRRFDETEIDPHILLFPELSNAMGQQKGLLPFITPEFAKALVRKIPTGADAFFVG
jgi:hypothetical protein